MVVLIDTNVVIDVLMKREPYAKEAQEILVKCATGDITGFLAAHSIPNLFYILRKDYSVEERRTFIKNLCAIFRISDLNGKKILAAAENETFSDFEDCLQVECAAEVMSDYIVTRNPSDFKNSRIKTIAPGELLSLLGRV
ncbi:PIN domain-containing protein [Lachnospiraceae bacterium 54-53]